jgi:hypothetical protein
MNRFAIKKHKLDDNYELSVAGTSSGSITHSTVNVSFKIFVRQYNEDNLLFGLISSGEEQPRTKCVVCDDKLENQAMFPGKLKRHLHKKHSHLSEKTVEYFKRLLADQNARLNNGPKLQLFLKKSKSKLCRC